MLAIERIRNRSEAILEVFTRSRAIVDHGFSPFALNNLDYEEAEGLYLTFRKQIESIYGKRGALNPNLLFHGSGRYRYAVDKYREDTQGNLEKQDMLASVVNSGLTPHTDLWLFEHEEIDSISLTEERMYARWYSHKHQPESKSLGWKYGDENDWLSYYFIQTFNSELSKLIHSPKDLYNYFQKLSGKNRLIQWGRSFTQTEMPRSTCQTLFSRTDIPNNYGVIYGIDKMHINFLQMKYGGCFELRTTEPISPNQIQVIEAPLVNLVETQDLVGAYSDRIPVLPVEAVDFHFSQLYLDQLI